MVTSRSCVPRTELGEGGCNFIVLATRSPFNRQSGPSQTALKGGREGLLHPLLSVEPSILKTPREGPSGPSVTKYALGKKKYPKEICQTYSTGCLWEVKLMGFFLSVFKFFSYMYAFLFFFFFFKVLCLSNVYTKLGA